MTFDGALQPGEVVARKILEVHQFGVEVLLECLVGVVDVRDATGHAGAEVTSGGSEDDHLSTRHVLATMIAHTLDDGSGAGVTDCEAFADDTAKQSLATGGAETG